MVVVVVACWAKVKLNVLNLDVGRIIGSFHFSIVPVGTLGVSISSYGSGKFLFGDGEMRQC